MYSNNRRVCVCVPCLRLTRSLPTWPVHNNCVGHILPSHSNAHPSHLEFGEGCESLKRDVSSVIISKTSKERISFQVVVTKVVFKLALNSCDR